MKQRFVGWYAKRILPHRCRLLVRSSALPYPDCSQRRASTCWRFASRVFGYVLDSQADDPVAFRQPVPESAVEEDEVVRTLSFHVLIDERRTQRPEETGGAIAAHCGRNEQHLYRYLVDFRFKFLGLDDTLIATLE